MSKKKTRTLTEADAKRFQVVFKIAAEIEYWIMKVSDFGHESTDYQNGDSEILKGEAWDHLATLRKRLRKALDGIGIDAPRWAGPERPR